MKHYFQYAKDRNITTLFFIFLASYLFLNVGHHPFSIPSIVKLSGGFSILNVIPYYNAETAYVYLNAYNETAIAIYNRILIFDFLVLIPVYVSFFSLSLFFLLERLTDLKNSIVQKIALLPFIAGFLNMVEDIIIALLLYTLPEKWNFLAEICGILTSSKSLITVICMLAIFGLYIVLGIKKVQKKRANSYHKAGPTN
ncbi:hypothetical protein [Flammeovirga aprica]|uniref:Uncharacterized protein n=1 Tax=Flammeovirga aprica JL-4 TaxID=694437 RepID=A0A7X9RVC2_9BACT|nr:hypothetical protein [Flammeovirga aprica]NME69309.1 hypothetical protein [Flammeovirga aprica JL-4]